MNQSLVHSFLPDRLLNSTVFYLVVTDVNGHCLYVNPLFRDHFSHLSKDLLNTSIEDSIHPSDRIFFLQALHTSKEFPGQPVSVTVRRAGVTGQWMRWEISTFKNVDGAIEGIVYIGHDSLQALTGSEGTSVNTDVLFGLDNEKVRALVNQIPGAIYRCRGDESISVEFFSDGIEGLTGYPVSYFMENRSSGYSDLVYEADREMLNQNDRRVLLEKGKFQIEYRIVHRNGEIKWVYESGKVNYEPGGDEIFIDGYIFDITHRKKVEAELQKSEDEVRRLALVAHNTTNSVMITDAEENIIWINEGYTRISGYTADEIKGKKIGYSLEGDEVEAETFKKIRHCLDNKLPYKGEFVSHTKAGDKIWLEVDCQPMYAADGKHLGFMAVENDITERKQTLKEQQELLQRLTLATDSAGIGIFEIDFANKHVIWDDRMYEIYHCPKDTGLNLFKVYYNAVHPEDVERVEKTIDNLLTGKKEISGAMYRIILPNGAIRHIESHVTIKKSDTGQIVSVIGTNRDVTEDVLAHNKIKLQNKVLRDIAFIQSHEVRRPLANILGVIEILQNSGALQGLEIFDHLIESAQELDIQIKAIVNKANEMDDEVFR